MRPSRFTPEQKAALVLRHLRGETLGSLHRECGVAISTLKLWKHVFLEAGIARLGKPIEWNSTAADELKLLLGRLSAELKDWVPELEL